ncbi:MAG: hypothetical protein M3459_05940, partial [Actinomycetota bacterium]|nr:hypothetical protein [Actinomycetota bacterium]
MGHSDRSDRLTGLDASFLHLEEGGPAHMHVASLFVFEGQTPSYRELLDHVEHRLALVPATASAWPRCPWAGAAHAGWTTPTTDLEPATPTSSPRPGSGGPPAVAGP